MTFEEMVDRYYELASLYSHESYIVSDEEHQEYLELCNELLSIILEQNAGVLKRLEDR